MAKPTETRRCRTCNRPLSIWAPPTGGAETAVAKPEHRGKYVCLTPLCGKYGLVVKVEPDGR